MIKKKKKSLEQRLDDELQSYEYLCKVEKYLADNRERFLEEFSNLCAKTNGRILYEDMERILGSNYPKATWLDANDSKEQIIQFFRTVGLQFKADETHLYFP